MNRTGWKTLYVAVQAFNLWTLATAIFGFSWVVRDHDYRNSVMYGALIATAALLWVGLRVARRVRRHFANPS